MAIVIEISKTKDWSRRFSNTVSPSSGVVISLDETRIWSLRMLQQKMQSSVGLRCHPLQRSSYVREFRQEFCSIARRHRGFSVEELCERLNNDRHLRWGLQDAIPRHWRNFYPFTVEFITNLESNIKVIPEHIIGGGGFAFGPPPGVPTDLIASYWAYYCGMLKEHDTFTNECSEFHWRELPEELRL